MADNEPKENVEQDTEISLNDDVEESSKGQAKYNDDLFFSTIEEAKPESSNNEESEEKKPESNNEESDGIFQSNNSQQSKATPATKEINLNDDKDEDPFSFNTPNETKSDEAEKPSSTSAQPSSAISPLPAEASPVKKSVNVVDQFSSLYDNDDDEDRDQFIEIRLSDPSKVGEGMGSYMVYKLTTKTNMKVFKSEEFSANRRFSDFLNLFEKLKEKHIQAGIILPPAPEKDMIGMAKVKMSKEDATPIDFIEKRRAALERFLNRIAKHKKLRLDPDFRDFLEIAGDLPKATNTSALSGAGMLKMFKNVTETVTKTTLRMEETDQWFEEKLHQVENLYIQFKKLHSTVEVLYGWRKDLAYSTKDFAKSTAILANSEEHLSISRVLQNLADAYEKVDQIYLDQSNHDYFQFSELAKDYVCLLDNIKEVFHQRVKSYSHWKKSEETLKSKRDQKQKLESSNKLDKVPAVAAEINDWEAKCEKGKQDFEQISQTIKDEMKRFDINRIKELKTELKNYLQSLLKSQELVVKVWEQYLPQVKDI